MDRILDLVAVATLRIASLSIVVVAGVAFVQYWPESLVVAGAFALLLLVFWAAARVDEMEAERRQRSRGPHA